MAEYRRTQYKEIEQRLTEPRGFIQVIVGPRQVGKSTIVNQVMQDIAVPTYSYNADGIEAKDSEWIHRTWESVRLQMRMENRSEAILVIDEIQKLENWSEVVKKEWDDDTKNKLNLKVVLLGSSRLLLRKGLTESLAGRFELIRMGHWTYKEMHDAFGYSLEDWIYFGGYPGAARFKENLLRWKKYIKDSLVSPAIEKDVIMTSNIYKPVLMRQLFDLGCSYSGEMLSLTKLLGQLQDAGNVTTLASYIEILKQCNLLAGLQKYANDDARKYQSVPKFVVYNNALLTAYRGKTFEKDRVDLELWGRWVESAVGGYLLTQSEDLGCKIFYWRERNEEVDFILQYQGETVALEVKSGRRVYNSGLNTFEKRFAPKHAYIVGTNGIPLEMFFQMNLLDLFG